MYTPLPVSVLRKGESEWRFYNSEDVKMRKSSNLPNASFSSPQPKKPTFTFANYNILMLATFHHRLLLNADRRYDHIVNNLLPTLHADVVAFNESNARFETYLKASLQNRRRRKNNNVKKIDNNEEEEEEGEITMVNYKIEKRSHYLTMVSYVEVQEAIAMLLPNRRQVIMMVITKDGEDFIVVTAHLESSEENVKRREMQFEVLTTTIENMANDSECKVTDAFRECVKKGKVCIMGDFNLHLPSEGKMIYRHGYVDCWLEVKRHDEGYSWDGKHNPLINPWYLPFDNRRMRLDRIVLRDHSCYSIDDIRMFGTEKIPGTMYLVPSDHYGLIASFRPIVNRSFNSTSTIDVVAMGDQYFNDDIRNFRTMKVISMMRLFCLFFILFVLVVLFFFFYRFLF